MNSNSLWALAKRMNNLAKARKPDSFIRPLKQTATNNSISLSQQQTFCIEKQPLTP